MCSVLEHRGPDDEGVYVKGNVGLGHRRLSILDLTSAGHQPMTNEDGSVRIIFNGEIYNYQELRQGLIKKGHCFSSRTDTETIIHLYEEKSVGCLNELQGMFAFALWDEKKKRLFLARDRLGKKPLVYSLSSESLVFASEIKALLLDPEVEKEISPVALHHYLTYQYVPAPFSIFKSIHKLLPAHYLLYENGAAAIHRYWDVSYEPKLLHNSLQEYGEHFLDVFKEAVRIRLGSDVPFGAFLSGGIDSSIVVAIMSTLLNRPVKTFSIGFEEEEYNELPYARMIADKYKTDHHEFIVKPDIADLLPKLIWSYNEPYADSSAVPTYYLAEMTRRHVTVALNGDGSDECFAGYPRHVLSSFAASYRRAADLCGGRLIKRAAELLPEGRQRHSLSSRLKRFVRAFYENPPRQYVRSLCHFDNAMKANLCTRAFKETVQGIDSVAILEALYNKADGKAHLDKILYVDVMSYLPEDLLVKVDIASMAHSLEARSPFLDHRVIEFAASLPAELKLKGRETKHLLKHTLGDFLPREILFRKKMGFGVPIDRWLRRELKEMAHDMLLDKTAAGRGYFNTAAVQTLLSEHLSGVQKEVFVLPLY